jgi:hypothetical protein
MRQSEGSVPCQHCPRAAETFPNSIKRKWQLAGAKSEEGLWGSEAAIGWGPMAKSEDQRGLAVYPRSGTENEIANHTENEEVGNDALACQNQWLNSTSKENVSSAE